MSDELKTEQDVVDVATEEQIVKDYQVASLEAIKQLPIIRKAKAVPFHLEDADLWVKIAPCTSMDFYKAGVLELKAIQAEGDERVEAAAALTRMLIRACVVEPELDDEAIEAFMESNAKDVTALRMECARISRPNIDTEALEGFG